MSLSLEDQFNEGIRRYEAGESADTLIPTFVSLCQAAPKNEVFNTCLSWLYLLAAQPEPALRPAQTAVKLNPLSAQSRVNLTLAMLELQKKGIRAEVERIQQILQHDPEQKKEVQTNLDEARKRRSNWPAADRLDQWLFLEP